MTDFQRVLALVRNELWQQPLPPEVSTGDAAGLLAMARKQAVAGLAASAIMRNALPFGEDTTMELMAIKQNYERKNRNMNTEVGKFARFLNSRGIDYVVMKGATVAALYPDPLVRSCGDIDFYCPQDSFLSTQQTIEERLNITMHHNWSRKHDNFLTYGYHFEMHSEMADFASRKNRKYWNTLVDGEIKACPTTIAIGGEDVRTLPPTLNALYIFYHAFYHLLLNGNGLGLKQFCDWAIVLHACRSGIDRTRLIQHLERLGLRKAFQAVGAFAVVSLGLPEESFPFALTADDRRWAERIEHNMQQIGDFQDKMNRTHGVSVRHSVDTARILLRQSAEYYSLAPREILWRFPRMIAWSVKKRLTK